MTEHIDEILKKSSFNQHTDEFLIKLEDMNEITKIMKELNESCNYLSFQIGEVVTKNQRYKQALEDIRRILDLYPHIDYSKSVTRRRLFDLANEALEGEK